MKTKEILILSILVVQSCATANNPFKYGVRDPEGNCSIEHADLYSRYLEHYFLNYYDHPATVEDFILNIRPFEDSCAAYAYKNLQKHKSRITIKKFGQLVLAFFNSEPFAAAAFNTPCDDRRLSQWGRRISYYDENGYFDFNYNIYDAVFPELVRIEYKYDDLDFDRDKYLHCGENLVFFLAYSPNEGLANQCTGELIDVESHDYFLEIFNLLKKVSKEHNLSKIIIPSMFPKDQIQF
jgi:hypothetical protein